jgi:hypothetical protein
LGYEAGDARISMTARGHCASPARGRIHSRRRSASQTHLAEPGRTIHSFVRIPAGVTHDFENRTDERMGLLNFFIPGGFEKNMPMIVDWFEHNR